MSSVPPPAPAPAADATAHDGTPAGILNVLLRDEIAATEAYRMTADRLAEGEVTVCVGLLRQLQEEHELASQVVRRLIVDAGGEAADVSGSWGAWATAVKCAGGPAEALGCLKQGETTDLELFERDATALDPSSARFVAEQLIPAQKRHVKMLEDLIKTLGGT